jgi:hypothetical protein
MELRRRRFRTAAGWCFARAKPPSSRPSAARAGTHNHRRLSWVRFRGDDPRLWSHFAITTASLVPAARFAPGVCNFASLTPKRGVGGAPRNVRVLSGTPVRHAITRHARRLARRLASHDAGRSPLGAPPWRFWALGPRFRLPHYTGAAQRAPRGQVVVPGGRGPAPPGANGYEPPPRDATPRSAFRIVSRTRPQ